MSDTVMTPDKERRCAKFAHAMLSDKRNENRYMMTDLRSKSGKDPISYWDVLDWLEYRYTQAADALEGDKSNGNPETMRQVRENRTI